MLDRISVRADAACLRARSAALNNHESRTAKSRELRSPALCLRPLGVDKPTRQPTALGGQWGARLVCYHFAPLHSAPLAPQAHAPPTAPPTTRCDKTGGTLPKARCLMAYSDSIAL